MLPSRSSRLSFASNQNEVRVDRGGSSIGITLRQLPSSTGVVRRPIGDYNFFNTHLSEEAAATHELQQHTVGMKTYSHG